MVDVDTIDVGAELGQRVALRGEVLFLGQYAGGADRQSGHDNSLMG
ncbi:hypothetical protein [uncultured Jatrophihabitans sp.]